MTAHTVLASLYLLNDWAAHAVGVLITTSQEPSVYQLLLSSMAMDGAIASPGLIDPLTTAELTWIFFNVLMLSAVAFIASSVAATRVGGSSHRNLLFGWPGDLISLVEPPRRYITAYVVTTLERDGQHVGYEGVLENLTLTADREVAYLTLRNCEPFILMLHAGRPIRLAAPSETPIAYLYLDRAQIRNIAFQVFEREA